MILDYNDSTPIPSFSIPVGSIQLVTTYDPHQYHSIQGKQMNGCIIDSRAVKRLIFFIALTHVINYFNRALTR